MGIPITGTFTTTSSGDTYAVTDTLYQKGGHKEVLNITERNLITSNRRREGLTCYVTSDQKTYQLVGGIDNSNWIEFSGGGGVSTLSGLTDTTINNLSSGNTLIYSGGTWINGDSSGGDDFTMPKNIVLVDPDEDEVVGERYQTWSTADTYVQTQSPSSSNVWGIKITGTNSENIIIRSYINIIGEDDITNLTGSLTSTANAYFDGIIYNCKIGNISMANGMSIYAFDCIFNGGTPLGILLTRKCKFFGGDYTSTNMMQIIFGEVYGGSYDNVTLTNSFVADFAGPVSYGEVEFFSSFVSFASGNMSSLDNSNWTIRNCTLDFGSTEHIFVGGEHDVTNSSIKLGAGLELTYEDCDYVNYANITTDKVDSTFDLVMDGTSSLNYFNIDPLITIVGTSTERNTSTSIYTGDGTISSDRIITANNNDLTFRNYDNNFTISFEDTLTSTGSKIETYATQMKLYSFDASNDQNGIFLSTSDITVMDEINSKGMEYHQDYSANFTDRSLVDKAYVDSLTTSINLSGLTDTTINNLSSGNTLIYSGGTWINGFMDSEFWTSGSTGTGSITTKGNKDSGGDATGDHSFAEGYNNVASGDKAHAEGQQTEASNTNSHSEGYYTEANGQNSHAEGYRCVADINQAHAEGNTTEANGLNSHSEGQRTKANGQNSHAEGYYTIANSNYSHTGGHGYNNYEIIADGESAFNHSYRDNNTPDVSGATGTYSVVLGGKNNSATGIGSFVVGGSGNTASGDNSCAEGNSTIASGENSHAEGQGTISEGQTSHAQGIGTRSSGIASHSGGYGNLTEMIIASGNAAFNHSVIDFMVSNVSGVTGDYSAILGGKNHSCINDNSVILGGDTIVTGQDNMVYVPAVMLSTTTTPSSPEAGTIYFNGTNFLGYNGSTWVQLDN